MRPSFRIGGRLCVAACSLALPGLAAASSAGAAPLTVCPSGCAYTTIPAALAVAGDGSTISVGAGTYSGGFAINADVRIQGAGAGQTIISGGFQGVFVAPGASVAIKGVTITGAFFAGIQNSGSLALSNSAVSDSIFGPGIVDGTFASLTVTNSTISGNQNFVSGGGGGLFNEIGATATISGSTITGNSALFAGGGGIFNSQGTVTLDHSVVSDNTDAFASGGGIYNIFGTMTLDRGTAITGNTAQYGGGIYNYSSVLTLDRGSTVTGNTATASAPSGGGIYVPPTGFGSVTLGRGSGVSGNAPDDCVGC